MVDYYSLISRAVKGIPPSMPGARQALYERARKTLVAELTSETPSAEAEIAAERHSLEAAIARVERELNAPPMRNGAASPPPVSRVSFQGRAAGGAAASASLAIRPPALPRTSPEERQEKPTLTELMRIVDNAMKEPAPPPPLRRVESSAAPTPSNRTVSADAESDRAAGVVRALKPLRERHPSATPELQLIGRSSQPEQQQPAPNKADLDRILRNLQVASPGIEASALISKTGLMIASAMAPRMDETRVAGVTATLLKLGGRASAELARGEVQELVVRADHGYAVMIGAGRGALLLALANESAKLGYIFFGMQETVKALEHAL